MEPSAPTVLAIESSCDETACAVVRGLYVQSSIVASQIEIHARFGGVVPELASRHHLVAVVPVVEQALAQAGVSFAELDGLAVTDSPGLAGALLVGVSMARGLSAATGLPLHGIHHMEGHVFSVLLGDKVSEPTPLEPHVALLVSGGHTELVHVEKFGAYTLLGATRDDAAGEAYDKVAKMLGLGYPGGPVIDKLAGEGNPVAHFFPRAMMGNKASLEFSFSGLKTAVLVHLERQGPPQSRQQLADLCASFQAAVVDVLVAKSVRACTFVGCSTLHVVGGVSANRGLRAELARQADKRGLRIRVPAQRYCGDNAAMIGAAGAHRVALGAPAVVEVDTTRSLDQVKLG